MQARLAVLLGRRSLELACNADVEHEILQALYIAHVPLKRLAFRRGLIAAARPEEPMGDESQERAGTPRCK
jgi:hypothetical protein